MGSSGTDFVTGCRDTGWGYRPAEFDGDVTTRFTYETFHTSNCASDVLFVTAETLRFQGVLY
jgi:hypothetical protein